MKPAAAYLRVSGRRQETEQQRRDLLQAAKARGLQITRWYAETITGRTLKRPALAQLRADAKAREVSILFAWSLDRLSRSGVLDSLSLLKELEACGCTVISLKDPIPEPGAPHRDLVLSVLFWVAEQESRRRSERVKSALARLKADGVKLGRRPRDVDVDRVSELRKAGRTWRSIAKAIKVPKATILRAVQRERG